MLTKDEEIFHLKMQLEFLWACVKDQEDHIDVLRVALEKLRDCDWVISLPDHVDAVRKIAREALEWNHSA